MWAVESWWSLGGALVESRGICPGYIVGVLSRAVMSSETASDGPQRLLLIFFIYMKKKKKKRRWRRWSRWSSKRPSERKNAVIFPESRILRNARDSTKDTTKSPKCPYDGAQKAVGVVDNESTALIQGSTAPTVNDSFTNN